MTRPIISLKQPVEVIPVELPELEQRTEEQILKNLIFSQARIDELSSRLVLKDASGKTRERDNSLLTALISHYYAQVQLLAILRKPKDPAPV